MNMMNMRKYFLTILAAALAILASSCSEDTVHGRVDQKNESVGTPQPVEVTSVRSIAGGAVIKVKIPDDQNIKGVVATYTRNGEQVESKISRYVDSLSVEGYADTQEHDVEICSFNVNEVKSAPVNIKITPNAPAIMTVTPIMYAATGGVKIRIEGNTDKSDLAVCLLRDTVVEHASRPVSDIEWVEITTLFTSSDSITLTRRGLEAKESIFGVYIRDHWGNISDTVTAVLQPLEEVQIPKTDFAYFDPGDDNVFSLTEETSLYPIKALWDGSGHSSAYHFFATDVIPIPCWFTIDLGHEVELSRIATWPRQDYPADIYAGASPREIEFWGSLDTPTGETGSGEHGFENCWVCLGKFEQPKPSGYNADGTVGEITQEDREYFRNSTEYELDDQLYPHAFDNIRYLRIVIISSFASWEMPDAQTTFIQWGEITPYGQVFK